jgi:hypothetical protein
MDYTTLPAQPRQPETRQLPIRGFTRIMPLILYTEKEESLHDHQ